MKKIAELTVADLTAYAFAEFGHTRFTPSGLSTFLCALLLSRQMRGADVSDTADLLALAQQYGYVVAAPGPRGGPGFAVTESGVEASADVVLPLEKFEKRLALSKEREGVAEANAGPMLEALYQAALDAHAKSFVFSVFEHWLRNKWLSSKQMAALSTIAGAAGFLVDQTLYIGAAQSDWVKPFQERRDARERARIAEQKAATQARHDAALAAQRLRKFAS